MRGAKDKGERGDRMQGVWLKSIGRICNSISGQRNESPGGSGKQNMSHSMRVEYRDEMEMCSNL